MKDLSDLRHNFAAVGTNMNEHCNLGDKRDSYIEGVAVGGSWRASSLDAGGVFCRPDHSTTITESSSIG